MINWGLREILFFDHALDYLDITFIVCKSNVWLIFSWYKISTILKLIYQIICKSNIKYCIKETCINSCHIIVTLLLFSSFWATLSAFDNTTDNSYSLFLLLEISVPCHLLESTTNDSLCHGNLVWFVFWGPLLSILSTFCKWERTTLVFENNNLF